MCMHASFSFITLTQVKMVLRCCEGSVGVAWQNAAASTQNKIVSLLHRQQGQTLTLWLSFVKLDF